MNGIGWAVKQMLDGKKVRRSGWNGVGMFIVYTPGLATQPFNTRPCITMWTAQKEWQPGWLCSQADLLAIDWEIAE